MAFEAYLTIEGQKQGPFKGESRREKQFEEHGRGRTIAAGKKKPR